MRQHSPFLCQSRAYFYVIGFRRPIEMVKMCELILGQISIRWSVCLVVEIFFPNQNSQKKSKLFWLFDYPAECSFLSLIRLFYKIYQIIKALIFLKSLISWEVVLASYLKVGQYSTDKDCLKFITLYVQNVILQDTLFPVSALSAGTETPPP